MEAEAVVDVPAITQLQFQQSFVEYVEVPQLQFFDRVVVQLLHRDRYTVKTVQKSAEIPRRSSWTGWDTPVVVQRQVLGFDSSENCGSTASAVL